MGLRKTSEIVDGLPLFITETEETHPLFEKKPLKREITQKFGVSAMQEAPSLTAYVYESGAWNGKPFPPDKDLVKIGSDKAECEICVADGPELSRRHAALRQLGEQWHVIECAQTKAMLINGVKRPQVVLSKGASCVLRIGSAEIVLVHHADTATARLNPERLYTVKSQGPELRLPVEGAALIGSNSECKIRMPGLPEFAGIIYNFSKRLYVHSLSCVGRRLSVDGEDASTPRHLRHKSKVSFAGDDLFSIEYPEDIREAVGFTVMPTFSGGHLALLSLGGGDAGKKLILPNAGRSIFLGRGAENHFVIESVKLSRKHAQLVVYDNSILALDCDSTNGTFVNGERIAKKTLHPGDLIQFGDRKYMLCHSE